MAAAARASQALSGFLAPLPCLCLEIYHRRRRVPGESAVPRRGGGYPAGPSPCLFPPSYLRLLWDQYY